MNQKFKKGIKKNVILFNKNFKYKDKTKKNKIVLFSRLIYLLIKGNNKMNIL